MDCWTFSCILTDELSDLIEKISPKAIITSHLEAVDTFKGILKAFQLNCPILIYENTIDGCVDLKEIFEKEVNIDEFKPPTINDSAKDIFMLTLSSSTTGKSKLIIITHKQILHFM